MISKVHHVIPLLLVTSVLAIGCASPIHIIKPPIGQQANPVELQVSLSATKYIYSWSVDLDGKPVSGYSPNPGPGVTSTAPLVFSESTTTYVLTTHSTCGQFCVWESETVEFTPPQPHWNATDYDNTSSNLTQFVTAGVFVGVKFPPSVPITVTVQEITKPPSIKLGPLGGSLQPPGKPLFVTIPANSTKIDFNVQAQTSGTNVEFRLTAPGTTPSTVGVFVKN